MQSLAGPPLLTDDPGTPGPNCWEINTAFLAERDGQLWSFETPLLDLNYGVGERIQLKYETPWDEAEVEHGGMRSGAGQSLLGIKWRFLDQEKAWLDLSTYPQYLFDNAASSVRRGLFEEDQFFLLPLEWQRQFGRLTVYGDGGYYWFRRRPNQWTYGVAAEYEIYPRFSIMGELHSYGVDGYGDDEAVAQLGFCWKIRKHLNLIGAAGRGLQDSSRGGPNFLGYLAMQFNLGKAVKD